MKITILGLGAKGSRIAGKILDAGHELTVWNRTANAAIATFIESGVHIAETPRDAVCEADIVISMVRDDEASRNIWLSPDNGALATMPKTAIGIESSTCTVSWIKNLSHSFAEQDIGFLDIPVVGSRKQAEQGKLIHLAGGPSNILDQVRPVLKSTGMAVHHVGPVGSGAAMKLIVNALLGTQVAIIAELLSASRSLGINPSKALEILAQTPPCSPAAKAAGDSMLHQNYAPAFPVSLMEKDLNYLIREADIGNLSVIERVRNIFESARDVGYGQDNMTAVGRLSV